jgi:DNA polymerase-3 subunit gamma/tau
MQDILRAEGAAVEDAVLPLVARAGAGSVRDSLSVLDQLLAGSDGSGLRYDRAVALLGYTDASLLDEIVDAFAAADGAAVFEVVNRVIEGGHEPRRFAADLLDRFRDLIVLAAVPDAAETGLLDLPQDRADLMAAQAARFGQAGLTRAAEIVSTGLDEMRGATSPRLLLELTCAQVLLPAAATDEKSLLARLERLEHADRAPAPRPRVPASPPHAGKDDEAERLSAAPPATRQAPDPARPPTLERPATGRPASERSAAPERPPAPERSATERPATERPATERPATEHPAPERPAPAATGTARAPAAASAVPGAVPAGAMPGAGPADVLRKNWDAVLESVKRERRVAAILLSDTSVVSVEGGILTLRFAKEGDLKRFSTSDYDADLKRVLSAGFGLNVMVKGVVGEGDAASTAPGRQPASPPAFAASRAAPLDDGPPDDEPPDEMMPDDLSPDEFLAGDAASGPAELTGMDLIQRELGGQVISEIED